MVTKSTFSPKLSLGSWAWAPWSMCLKLIYPKLTLLVFSSHRMAPCLLCFPQAGNVRVIAEDTSGDDSLINGYGTQIPERNLGRGKHLRVLELEWC